MLSEEELLLAIGQRQPSVIWDDAVTLRLEYGPGPCPTTGVWIPPELFKVTALAYGNTISNTVALRVNLDTYRLTAQLARKVRILAENEAIKIMRGIGG